MTAGLSSLFAELSRDRGASKLAEEMREISKIPPGVKLNASRLKTMLDRIDAAAAGASAAVASEAGDLKSKLKREHLAGQ